MDKNILQLWKTDLIPQYLLRMLSYSAVDFFTFFNKSGGGGGLSQSVKKGKFVTKIFFSDIVE